MALSQALSTGISGLMSHQKAMDNIGNNLANVNTTGFKMGVYQFSTILEQSLRGGMGANAATGRGSVNPIQMGMGSQTASINKVFTQGDIENTNNPNDMAIDGNGFFVVRIGNSFAYTRNGSFYRGEDGSLMSGEGMYVQGTAAVKGADGVFYTPQDAKTQNIIIPIGTTGGHQQTSWAKFTGNLNSDQPVSKGLQLFGSTSYPTVGSQQTWMPKDFNGGNILTDPKVDNSWRSLEDITYSVSEAAFALADANFSVANGGRHIELPKNVVARDNKVVSNTVNPDTRTAYDYTFCYAYLATTDIDDPTNPGTVLYHAGDIVTGPLPTTPPNPPNPWPMRTDALIAAGHVPLVQDIKTINGGNAQTSAAYGIEVPDPILETTPPTVPEGASVGVRNDLTLPMWFYESTEANPDLTGFPAGTTKYDAIITIMNQYAAGAINPDTGAAWTETETFARIWPKGINEDGEMQNYVPRAKEIYAASVDTPLEHLRYLKGTSWVQPFGTVKNGDEVKVSFEKGDSQMEITFVYNRPSHQAPYNGQVALHRENSYTLGHFLKFMAGDVDEPTLAAQNITPAMFGAPITDDYPLGNPNPIAGDARWNAWIAGGREAYEATLKDIDMAKLDTNRDEIGGALGLLSIPPQISTANYGTDSYDVPAESGGAYTRDGTDDINQYLRYDPLTNTMVKKTGDSFKTSFVSNLGEQNELTNIRISFNNVPHETMYADETKYTASQGGSSIMTLNFYDSLGNPKTANVRMAMVSQDNDFTTWRWYADCADDTDFDWQADDNGELTTNLNVGTGLIRFDKNGNYVKGAEYSESQGITINQSYRGVNEPIWIKVLNGLSSSNIQDLDFSTMTCTATESDFKLARQNGAPPSTLDTFTVSPDGTIMGVYENGNTVELGRIGLAMIPNENGLIAAGNNLYYTSPASGDAQYSHANTGGSGSIRHKALESSNVDLSIEFTKLISTERGFQANSRTITTADEMIQELLNLKR